MGFIKKTFNTINYNDLDVVINHNFPQFNGEYEFTSAEETPNYVAIYYNVDAISCESEIESGNWKFKTRTLLNILASRGVIESGSYLIEVSW